mgnify:CR=1 FL=1
MKKIKDFIIKYKAEILIALAAISSIVATLATTDTGHAVIYSIVIALIAATISVLKQGFTESTITLIAKAIEIIIKAINKDDTAVKSTLDENHMAVKADDMITVDEIKEELRKAL